MEITKTLYVTNRSEWRRWLSEHHATELEIWLVYYRKDSGKPRIPYNDAVEEALCFGWIDSTEKKIEARTLRAKVLTAQTEQQVVRIEQGTSKAND